MYDDNSMYICLPDPDRVAEPYFSDLLGWQIIDECDRLAEEAWQEEMMNQQWHQENSGWFKDYL